MLKDAGTILTANVRMAAFLQEQFCQQHNITISEKPPILPFTAWLQTLWSSIIIPNKPILLSKTQVLLKWGTLLQDCDIIPILKVHQTAKLAYQAYQFKKQWQIPDKQLTQTDKPEVLAFNQWAADYDHWLNQQGVVDPTVLMPALIHYWDSIRASMPQRISFYGFEELTPLVQTFMAHCEQQGITVDVLPESKITSQKTALAFADPKQEFIAAAQWAHQAVRAGQQVAIVCPDLAGDRELIDTTFRQVFEPYHILDPNQTVHPDYTISTGVPLAQYPVIKALFLGLQHNQTSSFFTHIQAPPSGQLSAAEYTDWLQRALGLSGWPGERVLNSIEYQAVCRFWDVLQQYKKADKVLEKQTIQAHHQALHQQCADMPFQAENRSAKAHILGSLEAAGLQFDGIWITGCDAEHWPPKPEPNPFIDSIVQREHHLPRSSAAREILFAQKILTRMLGSAPSITLSYPESIEQQASTPSQVVVELIQCDFTPSSMQTQSVFEQCQTPPDIEVYKDYEPIPLAVKDRQGGTQLLTTMHECPFKALMINRLKVPDHTTMQGISYLLRGNLIHAVVEAYYQKGRTETELWELINVVFNKFNDNLAHISPTIVQVEKQRLLPLLQELIQQDQAREFTLQAVESKRHVSINGLSIRCRIDRIDSTEYGCIVFDYKTGKVQLSDIIEFPPSSAQLPVYLLALAKEQPIGLGFISMNSSGVNFVGMSQQDVVEGFVVTSQDDWQSLSSQWQQWLDGLAEKVTAGIVSPDPLKGDATCRNCAFPKVCRWHERQYG